MSLVESYLHERTGGLRMQVVAIGLFRSIGETFGLYAEVRSAKINAADASTGNSVDLECTDKRGNIVIGVEVKDRELRLSDLQSKLPAIRERGIGEILFLIQGDRPNTNQVDINQTVERQFPSGHNIYLAELNQFLHACLILFGERGRRNFVRHVGQALDEFSGEISHRQRWAELLDAI